MTGVSFGAWTDTAATVTSVDWAITSTIDTFPDGANAAVTTGATTTNGYGYTVSADSFSTAGVNLAAGTYYLVLQNAVASDGGIVGWDETDGPSTAYEFVLGSLAGISGAGTSGSESFQIDGNLASGVPELSTWAMLLLGFGGLGFAGLRRRQSGRVAA